MTRRLWAPIQAKVENRATRTKRFNEALDNMKAMAEAQ